MFSCVHNRYYYFNSYHYYIYCIICAVVVSLYPVCLAFCEIKKRSRPMQVCSSRSSITGFGFVGFVSGCLYWFSFLVLFLFHSFFFSCFCARVSCFFGVTYLFIARVRAYLRVCLLPARARMCVTHYVPARMTGVGVAFFCFLLFIIFVYVLHTRHVPVCESVRW